MALWSSQQHTNEWSHFTHYFDWNSTWLYFNNNQKASNNITNFKLSNLKAFKTKLFHQEILYIDINRYITVNRFISIKK